MVGRFHWTFRRWKNVQHRVAWLLHSSDAGQVAAAAAAVADKDTAADVDTAAGDSADDAAAAAAATAAVEWLEQRGGQLAAYAAEKKMETMNNFRGKKQ